MRLSFFCLIGIILSLSGVSIISGTITRHIIQMAPLIALLIVTRQKNTWKSFAALPIFIFWFLIMFFIWLHLAAISKIVQGHFTTGEIILSIIMGICSLLGILDSLKYLAIKNKLANVLLTIATGLLLMTFMYILQIGNILNNYHHPSEIVIAVIVGVFILFCITTLLRNESLSKPLNSGMVIFIFSLVQVIAMWFSFHQSFSHD